MSAAELAQFVSIDAAARALDMSAEALRARCRRASRRSGKQIVADIGGGFVAMKFGRSWRVRLPEDAVPRAA